MQMAYFPVCAQVDALLIAFDQENNDTRLIDRWDLPLGDSKLYWDAVCKDLESRVSMTVKNPFSHPFLYPTVPLSSIPSSTASSVDHSDLSVDIRNSVITQPLAKAIKIASTCTDSMAASESPSTNATIQATLEEFTGDQPNQIPSSSLGLTKLSKMTRLVNNFLSNIRPRVAQSGSVKPKKISPPTKVEENDKNIESSPMTVKPSDKRSTDVPSPGKFMAQTQESTAQSVISGSAISTKKNVVFHDTLGEKPEKVFHREEEMTPATKPRRGRAPSLSIASAVPSFGKVVISIEDTDSIVNTEKNEETSNLPDNAMFLDFVENETVPRDNRNEQTTQDFLQVPQVRSVGHASYPIDDDSKREGSKSSTEMRLTDEAYESQLLRETRAFRKKYKFWPKRSIVNVFRAVKTMRTGLRRKARMEAETNRFFAAPLEVHSPSGRSSISSDNQTDFTESNVQASTSDPDDDEIMGDGNEWREKVDKESNASSYTSVRERLMRNAGAHLSKDSQHDAAGTRSIDVSNAPEVTFEQADPSSFYSSWATSKNEVIEKRPNKKRSGKHFIGIPRLNRVFPRVKADKCFACMCRSLGDTQRAQPRKKARTLCNDDINDDFVLLDPKLVPEIFDEDLFISGFLEQFYKRRRQASARTDKARAAENDAAKVAVSTISGDEISENLSSSKAQQSDMDRTKNPAQIDDPLRSRALAKSPSKLLVTARTLITPLVSDRTRSISDQDDSDQGLVESPENGDGAGGSSGMKNLAPCHMPINLKPSLEPLKALKNKKSRSIRSRVASAEKSGDSADDEENSSDFGDNIGRQSLNVVQKKLEAMSSPRSEISQNVAGGPDGEAADREEAQTHHVKSSPDPERVETDGNRNENTKRDSSDNLPIISDHEVVEIAKKCLANGITTAGILQILANEYSRRLTSRHSHEKCSPQSSNARANEKKAINLMTLLAESKGYLNRGNKRATNPPDLPFSSKQPSLCNARQLRRILPLKSYNLVAPILGMAKWYPPRNVNTLREAAKKAAARIELRTEASEEDEFDLIVHPPSRLDQNVSFEKAQKDDRPKLNPYSLFLMKPRRKVVTWRPLTERDLEGYDPEATLKKRVAKITDKICEDFCQWLESLAAGTNQTSEIDVEVLKDMFETDLTAEVCCTMQMCIKEMPMIPAAVAAARNCPGATELALTRKHLAKDAEAEMRPKKLGGFGGPLPMEERFKTPQNQVRDKWLRCENVPEDLETMDAVWKGITHLESVKVFAQWLKDHPEVKRPKGLEKLLSSKEASGTKKSMIHDFKDQELELHQIQSLKVADNAEDV